MSQTTTPSGDESNSRAAFEYFMSNAGANPEAIERAFYTYKQEKSANYFHVWSYCWSVREETVCALIARNAELTAAHAATERDACLQAERANELQSRLAAMTAENKALQSRLSGLADHCRRVYDIVPQLPIDERSMEGATDALHAFCIMLGVNGIDIDAARTPAAKENDDGKLA